MRGVGEPEERFSPLPLGLLPSCNPNEPLWMQFPRQRNCEKKRKAGRPDLPVFPRFTRKLGRSAYR